MKKVKAFTLVELLIVMGILIILIGLAVLVGRYSIRRSRIVHHKNAVLELERILVSFQNENGYVPRIGTCGTCINIEDEFFAYALGYRGDAPLLREYMDVFPFDGGNDTTYYYDTDDLGGFFVVCVALGGIDDQAELGYYCSGTGIGLVPEGQPILRKDIDPEDLDQVRAVNRMDKSDWYLNRGFARVGDIN